MNDSKKELDPLNKDNILSAVDRMGFNLEFKVEEIILNFIAQSPSHSALNMEHPQVSKLYQTVDDPLELDLLAKFKFSDREYGRGAFYIECKGGEPESKLFLIDSPYATYNRSTRLKLPLKANHRNQGHSPSIQIIYDRFACNVEYDDTRTFFVHNGDFFIYDKKNKPYGYKKKGGEERSNLYKGIQQLEKIIKHLEHKGFAEDFSGEHEPIIIYPVIVVSSEIYVVRYNQGDKKVFGPVPWVGYRSHLERGFVNIDDGVSAPEGKSSVYFSIVHVDSLHEFFKKSITNFSYDHSVLEL